ncbi:MAG: hypothetical protein QM813_15060 [Verrucomicrobiota bacterium]
MNLLGVRSWTKVAPSKPGVSSATIAIINIEENDMITKLSPDNGRSRIPRRPCITGSAFSVALPQASADTPVISIANGCGGGWYPGPERRMPSVGRGPFPGGYYGPRGHSYAVNHGCGAGRYRGPYGSCHKFGTGPYPGGYFGPYYRSTVRDLVESARPMVCAIGRIGRQQLGDEPLHLAVRPSLLASDEQGADEGWTSNSLRWPWPSAVRLIA